jgi:hypothetical protein
MDKITELKQQLYTDTSGRWVHTGDVQRLATAIVEDIVLHLNATGNVEAAKEVAKRYE